MSPHTKIFLALPSPVSSFSISSFSILSFPISSFPRSSFLVPSFLVPSFLVPSSSIPFSSVPFSSVPSSSVPSSSVSSSSVPVPSSRIQDYVFPPHTKWFMTPHKRVLCNCPPLPRYWERTPKRGVGTERQSTGTLGQVL